MSTAADERVLLTVAQAAELLQVSDDTVRRRIASGELPAVQLGGAGSPVRVDREELEEWLFARAANLRPVEGERS